MDGAAVPAAVVGAGNMGRHHARNYYELPSAKLQAIVDADAERGSRLADLYHARAYLTVDELLEHEPDVEAVSVATPTSNHLETASALLEAGKHVLVEKPIAPTLEQADQLIALAEKRSLVLAVGHVERFNPAVRELKRRIVDGAVGDVLSLSARRVGVLPPQINDANVIVDLAVHDIDVFRYLLGAGPPDELHVNAGRAIAEDRFDFADIFLRLGGVACFLQVNWITPVKIRTLSVTGTKAYAEVEYVTRRLDVYSALAIHEVETFADLEQYSEQPPERVELAHLEPLAVELTEFLRVVRGESGEIVSGAEARASMEIVLELVRLAEAA
jgi:UDP-N-acetylglucosamine 3-dehydrogenase